MSDDSYSDARQLAKQIVSFYEKRNIPIKIDKWHILIHGKRYKFRVIFKKKQNMISSADMQGMRSFI